MKKGLLLALCVLLGTFNAQAEKKFTVISDYASGTGMSPNGQYVVGIDPTLKEFGVQGMEGFRSFLWDSQTGSTTWMTEANSESLDKTGSFTDVTDDKIICGFFKDENYQITVTEWEGPITLPINVAAIWKDGQVKSLGIGDFKLSEFELFEDGSFATAISNNGKTVVGYVSLGNYAFNFPVTWKHNESTDNWDFTRLELPNGAVGGLATSVSNDGNIITGIIWYKNREVSAFWKDGKCTLIQGEGKDAIYNDEYNRGGAYSISPKGDYIAFKFNEKVPGIYSIKEKKYYKLTEYEDATSIDFRAIADNGNIFGSYTFGSSWSGKHSRPTFYSYKETTTVDFEYFLNLCVPDLEMPISFNYEQKIISNPRAVSADSKKILGNNENTVWVLQIDNSDIVVPATIEKVDAKIIDLKETSLTWNSAKTTDDYTLQSYNIYCDGDLLVNVAADISTSSMNYTHKNVKSGTRLYSISCKYAMKNGGEIESPKSNGTTVCMPSTFEIPLFDNFDSSSILTNYWTVTAQRDNQYKINFGAPAYQGIGWTPGMCTSSDLTTPYSAAVESRYLDARDMDKVYVSFLRRFLFSNANEWPVDSDTLSLEIKKYENKDWTNVKDYFMKKSEESFWIYEYIDLSEYAAQSLFQVRLRIHGLGQAQYSYYFDLFKVGSEVECTAPTGIIGENKGGKVNLAWKNKMNAYEIGYSVSNYEISVLRESLGDEGNTFIAVNKFDPEDLDLYNGKYLTSVTAFINHDPGVEDSKETHASIVIYENGELIREQQIEDIIINTNNTLYLKEPVKIDVSKELKIGIKIFDYDERQIPISYQITDLFKAGKSDLYSQDNGKTWKKLSEYYASIEDKKASARPVWEIVGNVTDEPTVDKNAEKNESPVAYTVYRNGERVNYLSLYLPPRFTDKNPVDNASYQIIAYYENGNTSTISDPYKINSTSIDNYDILNHQSRIYPNPATDCINIPGDFNQAILLNINGQVVLSTTEATISVSSLPAGVYFLKIENGDAIHTEKVMIKR